jgi:hypothetical protein
MVHEHLEGLRLDRRVLRRRDWISPADLQKALAALPDVSDKIQEPAPEAGDAPAEGAKS